jgi:long-chain acyl-CoA synthetase
MFWGALGLGLRASRTRQKGEEVPAWIETALRLADRIVFSKIRDRFGGSIKLAASGAAPLGKELAEFYDAIGMPLIEGYGLTEGGVATLNPVEGPRIGSIGKALPGVDLRLGDDNELLIRSECLMMGYFNDPDATRDVMEDGWLHTGDVAEVDADGYVRITGRKKEMIVASNGKKIYPSRVESLFKIEPLISQIVLVGDRMPYISALFTLNAAAAEGVKGMEGMEGRELAELSRSGPVLDEVKRAVARVNKNLAPYEQIRKFRVLDRDFSIDQGELTPTMKVRRARVLENWKPLIQEMYAGKEDLL